MGAFVLSSRLSSFSLVSLLLAFGFGLFLFVLPFMAYDLSSSVFMVGIVIAVPALVSLLAAVPAGDFAVVHGVRYSSVAGLFVMAFAALCLSYSSSLPTFLLSVCLLSAAYQLVYTSLKVHLLDISPSGASSKYFSVLAASFQLGLALGPVAGGFLMLGGFGGGVALTLRLFSLDCLTLMFLFFVFGTGDKRAGGVHRAVKKGFAVSVMEYLKLGCVGVLVFWLTVLFTSYEGLVWAFEPLFSRYYDMSPLAAGVILSLFTVPFILFSIPAGVLADRYGKMRTLVPGLLLTGLFVMSFGLAGDFFTLALSALLSTTGLAFAWASTAGLLADSSKRLQKGYIAGVWSMSEGLGYLVGPVLGGLVGQYFSVKVPFVLLGAVFVVTAILLASRWWRYLLMLKLAPFRGQSS